jgi:diguanylate cyclase (GGDEF)-like protein
MRQRTSRVGGIGIRFSWQTYLLGASVAIAAYLFTPSGSVLQTVVKVTVGWTAAACIVLGVRRHRPSGAAIWYWFAAGIFANVTGILVEAIATRVYAVDTYPTVADVFWLGLYPALIVGMTLLIRRRSADHDWASIVDACTIATGLGLLCWVFVIHPATSDPDLTLLGRAVVGAYPLGDLLVLAMMVRLLLGGGSRNTSFRLMIGSVLVFLGGDVGWVVVNQLGVAPGRLLGNILDAVFLLAFALFGVAALHPSMGEVDEPSAPRTARLSLGLLALLTSVSLIAPGVLLIQATGGQVTDGVAIAVGSTALFLLVVARMAQLLRQVEAQAARLRELAGVDELTGLPNRRGWTAELSSTLERARRDGGGMTVAMIDLDHFKRFNDELGHPAGDRLLKDAATLWREQLRTVDQLARYGGEEFIVLFHGADVETANEALARLRTVTPAGQTFSGGVARWNGTETSDELVARADRALYEAKSAGRDCVINAPEEPRYARSA